MENNKNKFLLADIIFISVASIVVSLAVFGYGRLTESKSASISNPQAALASVSVGKDVQPAAAPVNAEIKTDTAGWLTLGDKWHGISLKYPETFRDEPAWTSGDWPPHVIEYPAAQTGCPGNYAIGPNAKVDRIVSINGTDYEIYDVYVPSFVFLQGVYENVTSYYYCYVAKKDENRKYAVHFKLEFSDCGNAAANIRSENDYDIQPQKCGTPEQLKDVEQKMQDIVATIKIIPPRQNMPGTQAGWRVYQDEKRGFKMEYPEGTDLRDGDIVGSEGLAFLLPDNASGLDFPLPDKILVYAYKGECVQWTGNIGSDFVANDIVFSRTDISDSGFNILDYMDIKASYCTVNAGTAYTLLPSYSFPRSDFKEGQLPDKAAALKQLDRLMLMLKFQFVDSPAINRQLYE